MLIVCGGPETGKSVVAINLLAKATKLIIEMQRSWQDFFRERSIFCVSRTVSEELPGGKEHEQRHEGNIL